MAIRGVLFDMGGTLLHYKPAGATWEENEKIGAKGVYDFLRAQNHALPDEAEAVEIFWQHFLDVWTSLGTQDVSTLRLDHQVGLILNKWGVDSSADNLHTDAARAYMTTIQAHVRPLDGAETVLRTLRERGFRVGVISNTIWPNADHMHDLNRHNLTPHIEHFIFSGEAETWKPYRDIFQRGLDALNLTPDQAVYVGDSLYFDVWGAQQAGLRGVWVESERYLPPGMEVTPDATLARLPDLLDVLDSWQ